MIPNKHDLFENMFCVTKLQIETITPVTNVKEEKDDAPGSLTEETYYEARIQAGSLIHPAFIEAFIKRGERATFYKRPDVLKIE